MHSEYSDGFIANIFVNINTMVAFCMYSFDYHYLSYTFIFSTIIYCIDFTHIRVLNYTSKFLLALLRSLI